MFRHLIPILAVIIVVACVGFVFFSKRNPSPGPETASTAAPQETNPPPTAQASNPPRAFLSVTPDDVRMLTLTDAGQGHVNGQYSAFVLDPQGHIKPEEALVEGTIEETKVTLSLTVQGQNSPLHVIGTHDAHTMTLTFGFIGEPTKTHLFEVSDVDTFKADAEALNAKSEQMLGGKAATQSAAQAGLKERDFSASSNELIIRLQAADQRIDTALPQLPQNDAKYHSISAQIGSDLQKVKGLAGANNLQQRDAVVGDMNQGLIATEQVHTQVQAIKNDFARDVLPLFDQLTRAEDVCASQGTSPNAVCAKLASAGQIFNDKCKALQAALADLEKSYQNEFSGQQDLIAQAGAVH